MPSGPKARDRFRSHPCERRPRVPGADRGGVGGAVAAGRLPRPRRARRDGGRGGAAGPGERGRRRARRDAAPGRRRHLPPRPARTRTWQKNLLKFPIRSGAAGLGVLSTTIVINFPNARGPIGFGKLSMFWWRRSALSGRPRCAAVALTAHDQHCRPHSALPAAVSAAPRRRRPVRTTPPASAAITPHRRHHPPLAPPPGRRYPPPSATRRHHSEWAVWTYSGQLAGRVNAAVGGPECPTASTPTTWN